MTSSERVLLAVGRLQDETAGTSVEALVAELVAALAADTTTAELRQEVEYVRADGGYVCDECGEPDGHKTDCPWRKLDGVSVPVAREP